MDEPLLKHGVSIVPCGPKDAIESGVQEKGRIIKQKQIKKITVNCYGSSVQMNSDI